MRTEGMAGWRLMVLGCVLWAAGCDGPGRVQPPVVGGAVPEMQSETLAGQPFSLRGMKGEPVLINLWATWCAPCRAETPFLQEIHEEYGPKGLRVVGISLDGSGNRPGVDAFIEEYGVTYTMVHDPAAVAMDLFFVIGLPATFLVDPDGRFRLIRLGPVGESDQEFMSTLEDLVL